ncbi:MAG: GerAB/ArcD/ProY family transporter [Clostridia bacterium]|nr:GerAB/ArcD/ProY family transporter [Clostridia bacterium]
MNRFSITRRQALFLFIICTISSKLQTLPCMFSEDVGNNLWLVLLFGAAIDIIFFSLTILINHLCPNLTIYDLISQTLGKVVAKLVCFVLILYFLFTALMPYEAVRNVFANNLFDTLPWQTFSIFLIFAVGYLAFSGLKTIGRSSELYLVIIVASVGILVVLGAFSADFGNILPVFNTNFAEISKTYVNHSIWFGDYMIFLCLLGRIDTSKRALKQIDVLIYAWLMIFYAFGYIVFYCLYTVLASSQTSLISSISAFSLLNLSVGRPDWFLVLLSQIASVLSLSTYLYCVSDSLNNIFGKKHYAICSIISVVILYLLDFLLFSHSGVSYMGYMHISGVISLCIQLILPVFCVFCAVLATLKNKKHTKERK